MAWHSLTEPKAIEKNLNWSFLVGLPRPSARLRAMERVARIRDRFPTSEADRGQPHAVSRQLVSMAQHLYPRTAQPVQQCQCFAAFHPQFNSFLL